MLQQDAPDDYVLATGDTHSVQRFVELAFEAVGLDHEDYIVQDPRFMRPAEVDLLVHLILDQVKPTCCIHKALDTQVSCTYTQLSEKQGLIS